MRTRTVPPRLFDVPGTPIRHHAGTSMAVEIAAARDVCPTCGYSMRLVEFGQAALLWLHGFGGTEVIARWRCARCGYARHHSTTTVTPR